jgi:citrate lyase subunit beta/citryl-CoA lyase
MPGSNARALEKSRTLAADALILDLEDAVAPEAKDAARASVAAALAVGGFGRREVVVRINRLESPWGVEDLMSLTITPPNAVLLPKVESPHEIEKLDLLMDRFTVTDRTMIWCMLETPKGVLNASAIAKATLRLQCLVMGTSDLAKDLRVPLGAGRAGLIPSLGLCLLAARAAGIDILDGVHLDLDDDAGFEAACRQGVELGFDGKTLIHPRQIDACNRIFQPGLAEIEQAKQIIAAFAAARAQGQGVAVLDGRLIEHLHVESAMRTVAVAEAIAAGT